MNTDQISIGGAWTPSSGTASTDVLNLATEEHGRRNAPVST
ncbi:hypothetical protein OG496_11700 [Streptomyces sp. NBC_00988]|nr:hypothetical protein OG496_11700 [Streptomyces sp. NBC_00988]